MNSAKSTDSRERVVALPPGLSIRPLREADIQSAVEVHLAAFPTFFLSFLGAGFLRELYSAFSSDANCIALAAFDERGKLLGSVAGPLQPAGYFSGLLKRRWFAFALASTGAVLKKPTVLPRLFRAVFYRGESPAGPARALLSTIAVDPRVQGGGIGRSLVQAWLEEVRQRGAQGAYLTTDADQNDAVNAFYQRMGWRIEHTFSTPEGRRMHRYVQDFN